MVPNTPHLTPLTFGDLNKNDLFKLDNLPLVSLTGNKFKKYSLSDLILELSHLYNTDLVN